MSDWDEIFHLFCCKVALCYLPCANIYFHLSFFNVFNAISTTSEDRARFTSLPAWARAFNVLNYEHHSINSRRIQWLELVQIFSCNGRLPCMGGHLWIYKRSNLLVFSTFVEFMEEYMPVHDLTLFFCNFDYTLNFATDHNPRKRKERKVLGWDSLIGWHTTYLSSMLLLCYFFIFWTML